MALKLWRRLPFVIFAGGHALARHWARRAPDGGFGGGAGFQAQKCYALEAKGMLADKGKLAAMLRLAGLTACLCVSLLMAGCGGGGADQGDAERPLRDPTPVVLTPEAPNSAVLQNEKAILDYSNAAKGYISVKSLVPPTIVKVLVDFAGTQYQYTLAGGEYVTIPLSCGDGEYAVSLWENVYDDQYAAIFSQNLQAQLEDQFLPFLYPNQYVNFSQENQATAMSGELATGATGIVQVVENIYSFVVGNIVYDYEKAAAVSTGYLPAVDETLDTKKGICFDYAVLTASMLRAQRIPTKLVIGYAGSAYHSWIEVYSPEEGWIKKKVHFDGQNYVLMDPTFDSADQGKGDWGSLVGDGMNYSPRFLY
jgi:transglutaminase-like putative cysteine protease